MRAVVTGGCGFIGSHLVERLVGSGWDVVILDRAQNPLFEPPGRVQLVLEELGNRGALARVLKPGDVVFHLAWSGVHSSSNQDLRGHVELNLLPTISLLEACVKGKVKRVVFLSSGGTVYGPTSVAAISESHPTAPISGYGATKLAAEQYLRLYRHLDGLESVTLRPSVAYGERQSPYGVQGAVAVFMGRVLRGEPVTIWGDGSVVRDYLYAGDLADACIRAATAPVQGRTYNVGSSQPVTVLELAEKIGKTAGKRPQIQFQEGRAFDAPSMVLDCMAAKGDLLWNPQTALEEGLARTLAWMRRLLGAD